MAFTWTPFYKELSDWLLEKQDSQSDLISIPLIPQHYYKYNFLST